ncbi:unnamed protein product [Rhizoctonia solani]|uniref:Alpha/beta hydrolase fold-3 domain-containing protein n=1 Tax=Rhizoctonia solani TaxID=456999 RepID=A0A8H3BK57_9AGAM|nr:unnamed protein product [Rhizoctonia solani]
MDPLTRLFHLRPFGFLYMLYKRILILAKTPFQAVLYLLGVNKLRSSWTLKKVLVLSAIREIINAPARTGISGGRDHTKEVAAKDCLDAKFIWVNGVPDELVVGEIKRLAQACGAQSVRIPAYGFGNWGSSGDLARDGEKIVLNLHGGGYIIGTAHPEDLTANIPRGYLSYGISRVFSVDYRLSTTHPYPTVAPFPSALLDALAGYVHLTRTLGFKPQNVIMSGDSAGANLALALIRYLRDSPELGLGMPGGLVAISPWADPKDGNMNSRNNYALRALVGPMSVEDAGRNPYIAPGSSHLTTSGLFKGFPPTYIVGGEAEALIQEIRVLQSRMKEDCEVVYDEVLDAVHDFVVFPQWEPERSETFKKIADWIQNL